MYMLLQTCIGFVLVGIFYGTFSSIVRLQFDNTLGKVSSCVTTETAAILENIFILLLAGVFMYSTMIDIQESDMGFKILILGFGLLQIFTVMSIFLVIYQTNFSDFFINIDTLDKAINLTAE